MASASASASAASASASAASASALDQQFIRDLTASIEKAGKRSQCPYDNLHKACYRKNPAHFEECSHSIHYCEGDIKAFKPDTDKFLDNSFEIYNIEYQNFSQAWHTKISARTGDESTQFAQSDYRKHDSFYFLLLANIMTHLEEYITNYGTDFLIFLLGTFESDDATGFYTLDDKTKPPKSAISQKLKNCGVREWWLLGNTTIKECVKNMANPNKRKRALGSEGRSSSGKGKGKGKGSSGGKGTSGRKTKKRTQKSKRSKSKRSKSKRSKSKRSKSKRSKSKRSKSKKTKKNKRTIQ
jgi:hypothetical protein